MNYVKGNTPELVLLCLRLFDEAAGKLNLCALVGFLSELCAASRAQLFSKGQQQHQHHQPNQGGGAQYPLLLLNRLSEVMLRCARGGRPLVHIMKAWSIVAPHFVEVAFLQHFRLDPFNCVLYVHRQSL